MQNLWFEYVFSIEWFSAHSSLCVCVCVCVCVRTCVRACAHPCVSSCEANIYWTNVGMKHFMSSAVFITPLTLINKSLFSFPGSHEEEPIQWVFLFFLILPLSLWRFGSGERLPFWLLFLVFLGRDVSRQASFISLRWPLQSQLIPWENKHHLPFFPHLSSTALPS